MVLMLGIFCYLFYHGLRGVEIKSRIRDTKNLSTDVDSSTDIYIWVKRTRMDIMQNSVTFCSTSERKYTHFKTGPTQNNNM